LVFSEEEQLSEDARIYRDAKVCWANLRIFEEIADQFAVDNCCSYGEPVALEDYVLGWLPEIPPCPSGGNYLALPNGMWVVCTSGLPGHSMYVHYFDGFEYAYKDRDPLSMALRDYSTERKKREIGEVLWEIAEKSPDLQTQAMAVLATACLPFKDGDVFDAHFHGTRPYIAPEDEKSRMRFDLGIRILMKFVTTAGGSDLVDDDELWRPHQIEPFFHSAVHILNYHKIDLSPVFGGLLELSYSEQDDTRHMQIAYALGALDSMPQAFRDVAVARMNATSSLELKQAYADLLAEQSAEENPKIENYPLASRYINGPNADYILPHLLFAVSELKTEGSLRILIDLLASPDLSRSLQQQVLFLLGRMGQDAKLAIPMLLNIYKDEKVNSTREKIAQTILTIAPDTEIPGYQPRPSD